jgi:hypothetical protein
MKFKNTSQQYFLEKIIPTTKFSTTAKRYLNSFNAKRGLCRMIRNFISFGRCHKEIYFSQEWLGKKCNIRRETVNRYIKKLDGLGLIAKKFNGVKRASNYRVSEFLLKPTPDIIKVLIYLGIFLSTSGLMSKPVYPPYSGSNDITLIKNDIRSSYSNKLNNYLYFNNSINGRYKKKIQITEKSMSVLQEKRDSIEKELSELNSLNLTLDQKFKLIVFPQKALSYALTQFRYSSKNQYGTKHSYRWFKYLCEEYCNKYDLVPDWRTYYQLQEVFITSQPKKEKEEVNVVPPRIAYSYKLPESYLAIRKENPLHIFSKQYRFMLTQSNSVIPQNALWEMGVARFVRTSFYGYLGEKNMCPDLVLAHIDALVDSTEYKNIITEFGLDAGKRFVELCIESVLEEQGYTLNQMKMSYYGKGLLAKKESTELIFTQNIITRTKNVDEFMHSDSYGYLAQLVGETTMKDYIYRIVENWMKIIQ